MNFHIPSRASCVVVTYNEYFVFFSLDILITTQYYSYYYYYY